MSLEAASAAGYHHSTKIVASEREIEYRVLSQVTGDLVKASSPSASFADLAAAVHANSRLWTALAADLASDENGLPVELRAQLFNLALFSRRHASEVLARRADAQDLIAINRAVMGGLRGQTDARAV